MTLNIQFLGEYRVGRSSLIIRETKGTYEDQAFRHIIGVDFFVKEYDVGDQKVKVRLWDPHSSEDRYRRYSKVQFKSKYS
jgi:hypothetical protein